MRQLRKIFCLVVMLLGAVSAWANDMYKSQIQISDHMASGGYIEVKFPHYDEKRADEGLYYNKDGDNAPSYIKINGKVVVRMYSFHDDGEPQEEDDWYWCKYKDVNNDACAAIEYKDNNGEYQLLPKNEWRKVDIDMDAGSTTTFSTLRIYPSVKELIRNKGIVNVDVHLRVDINNDNGDYDLDKPAHYTFTPPTAKNSTVSLSKTVGSQEYSFMGRKAGDTYDFKVDGKSVKTGTVAKDNDQVKGEIKVSNNVRELMVAHGLKMSAYQWYPDTTRTKIPAYFLPDDLKLNLSRTKNADVLLEWTVSADNYDSNNQDTQGNWIVERATSTDFKDAVEVYNKPIGSKITHKETYKAEDKVTQYNLNGIYYYRLRRTNNEWGGDPEVCAMAQVDLQLVHKKVASAFASSEGSNVTVTWEWNTDGNVWSEGSKVYYIRHNKTMQIRESPVALTDTQIAEQKFTDQLPTACDSYLYYLYVEPGSGSYGNRQPEVQADMDVEGDGLFFNQMGKLTSLKVSKGYHNDFVELKWSSDGNTVEYFTVLSRVHSDDPDVENVYEQIASISGSALGTDFNYSDTRAVPGVIYDYKVLCNTKCGGKMKTDAGMTDVGFRSPTGEVNGRITFENGQAVEGVTVTAESTEDAVNDNRALLMDGEGKLTVGRRELLSKANELTVQAWVNTASENCTLFEKFGMFSLYLENDVLKFKVRNQIVEAPKTLSQIADEANINSNFMHISAVAGKKELAIYVNAKPVVKAARQYKMVGNFYQLVIAEGMRGVIDDIRVWDAALDSTAIANNYTRYMSGNEKNLVAYYNLDMATSNEFFDSSYSGPTYNENHGTIEGGTVQNESVPEPWQMGHRDVTNENGSYTVRSIPFTGNGTTYMIVPQKGSHSFSASKELRTISQQSTTYTVNFIDNSSFEVSGTVIYEGGTVPVEDVEFKVDGVTCVDGKKNIIKTDSEGNFTIRVPVGTHEVKAFKPNHTFVDDGRITNSDGTDRNYQDIVTGLVLKDNTRIKLMGRVAGGTVQDGLDVGFGLSKNNLGEAVTVTLTYQNPRFTMAKDSLIENPKHYVRKDDPNKSEIEKPRTNRVETYKNDVVIYPNKETGEFWAEVIPERFSVTINAPGYEKACEELAEEADFRNSLVAITAKHTFNDTIYDPKDKKKEEPIIRQNKDSLTYYASKKYTLRVAPEIELKQLSNTGQPVDFFGVNKLEVLGQNKKTEELDLYNEDTGEYKLGRPVFTMGNKYTLRAMVHEAYTYNDSNGDPIAGMPVDKVPSQKAKVTFVCEPESKDPVTVEADSTGVAEHTFKCGTPDMQSGVSTVTVTARIGSDTSFEWDSPLLTRFITVGARQKGTDFVTKGPSRMLTVLRDPPGSNSYSYLEKGTTVRQSISRANGVHHDGSETLAHEIENKIWIDAAGTISLGFQNELGFEFGAVQDIESTWDHGTETTTTFSTRVSTSSDPDFVGPRADVYVGYANNLIIGSAEYLNVISRELYEAVGEDASKFSVFTDVTPLDDDYLLVRYENTCMGEEFATLFAYPQCYIEEMLLPSLERLRNSLLHHQNEMSDEKFAALATQEGTPVYVSKREPNDPDYGATNTVASLVKTNDYQDGDSYKMYYPGDKDCYWADTICAINNDILLWEKEMAMNEEKKCQANDLIKNFSFQSGAKVEYSEAFTFSDTKTYHYEGRVGGHFKNGDGFAFFGTGLNVVIEENLQEVHIQNDENGTEYGATMGFELSDDDGYDYFSVDVLRENNPELTLDKDSTYTSTFIFRTRAGASMCPYEGEYVTKYWEKDKHVINAATLQIEVPKIRMEKTFIDNVPSGEAAAIELYLSNSTEMAGGDCIFNLMLDDSTNPDGLQLTLDGAGLGNGHSIYIPAGETVKKTLLARKAAALNYDNIKLILVSRCQGDPTAWNQPIKDETTFSVHFTPSATPVNIKKPEKDWIYNLNTPTRTGVGGKTEHYMEVKLDGFDTDYDNFRRIMLQYKASADGEEKWTTLMSYYKDQKICDEEIEAGHNAAMIKAEDKGVITYQWCMDGLMDAKYDLRAVGTSVINNIEYTRASEVYHGLKDMEPLRLFGDPLPANGVLRVGDEIRLNFNKELAKGYLSQNNFEVTGIRNGAQGDHSVSVLLDGENDALIYEASRNLGGKDLTIEMWVNAPESQDAVYFAHGDKHNGMEFGITSDDKLRVKVGEKEVVSDNAVEFKKDEWQHVAMTLAKDGTLMAYYDAKPIIQGYQMEPYKADGQYVFGAKTSGGGNFKGKMHGARIWDTVRTGTRIQSDRLTIFSGTEMNLVAYYPMNEGRGEQIKDKAHSAHLQMGSAEWSLPQGRAATFNGKDQYVKISTGAVPIENLMDYSIELWFKAARDGNENAALVANGVGDGSDDKNSYNAFFLGFIDGQLTFRQNGVEAKAEGDWLDDDWHHLVLTVSRASKRGQFVIDGKLNSYFDADKLGAIASAYMSVGARSYVLNAGTGEQTEKVDMYLNGTIDELRLWNVYKNAALVEKSINVQLDGDETGLLAYYPFEKYITHQGTQEMLFSLQDFRKVELNDPAPDGLFFSQGDTVKVIDDHCLIATKQAAPVRGKGEVSKLKYDYVANSDALIISLKEDLDRIENTTVAFAVKDIQDVNGNPLLSPVLWTAFIDRNQLRWVDNSEQNIEIYQTWISDTDYFIDADIVNEGGSSLDFSITNLPSWLKATPSSGTLNPTAKQTIRFTIKETVNVGTYNELIYLTGENNVTECLPLNIRVKAWPPQWEVNPSDYQYSMSVFGKIKIGDEYSTDTEDMLAAFDGDECVGVTHTSYVETNDMYYALLTIYSNKAEGGDFRFRIWDANTGNQYIAKADSEINFVNNSVVGDSYHPVIFSATTAREQRIPLNDGWTWISINVNDPSLSNINSAIGGYDWSEKDIIKSEETNTQADFYEGRWVGGLTALSNTMMYHVKTSTVEAITIEGVSIDPQKTKVMIVGADEKGNPRWNYIPYLPTVRMEPNRALSGYEATAGDLIKSQTAFAMYSDNLGWVGNLDYMEPGRGYMLKRVGSGSTYLQYPSTATRAAMTRSGEAEDNGEADGNELPVLGGFVAEPISASKANMTLVAEVTGLEIEDGDLLTAYVGGQLRGTATATVLSGFAAEQERPVLSGSVAEQPLFFLTIAGDDPGEITLCLKRGGETIGTTTALGSYSANRALGSPEKPVVLDMSVTDFGEPQKVEAYDLLGRKRDPKTLSGGVFIIRKTINGRQETEKVIKK